MKKIKHGETSSTLKKRKRKMKKMMLISLEKPMTSKNTDWFYYTKKRRERIQKEIQEGIKEVKKDLEDLRNMKKEE